jgi:hypothetical protein
VTIISCIFNLYFSNLSSLIIIAMNPIITKTKAILCKSYEIEIDSNMFIRGLHRVSLCLRARRLRTFHQCLRSAGMKLWTTLPYPYFCEGAHHVGTLPALTLGYAIQSYNKLLGSCCFLQPSQKVLTEFNTCTA